VNEPAPDRGIANIWSALRRRKVVQWGVVYVAAAWGFLQGLEYLSGTYDWPRQIQQLTTLALLIGLPIVLVLAWYHGDRGQQRVSTPEFAILTLLLLLGGGAFWYYQRASDAAKDAPPAASAVQPVTSPAVTDPRPSVAVLPFENRSRLEDDAYFVDGIHDDVLTQLSKVSALKVISRTSVEQFRGTKLPLKEIGSRLGVKSILEGGVQRAGDRIRINVQLIDVGTDAHLWAETYDRELTATNVFGMQSEISESIAGALRAKLTTSEMARSRTIPTENLDAWEAYQLGKQSITKRTSEGLKAAEGYLRKAIALDPTFALAYSSLADALSLQVSYSGKSEDSALEKADGAAVHALTLDPELSEGWAARGGIALHRNQLEEAEQYLQRAIDLNPNYATAHHWLTQVMRVRGGREEQELSHAKRASQLDPLSPAVRANLGNTLEGLGRFDEAALEYQHAFEKHPSSAVGMLDLAFLTAYARNRFPDAVSLLERASALDPDSPRQPSLLAWIHLDLNKIGSADSLCSTLLSRWPDSYEANAAALPLATVRQVDAAAIRYATKLLIDDPRESLAMGILRNTDLRRGQTDAARKRYLTAFPELFAPTVPQLVWGNYSAAVDLAAVLQRAGEIDRAAALLDAGETYVQKRSRLGSFGFGITDVQIYALRGDKSKAVAALREAERAGWRGPLWRYYRDIDPNLDSIRSEREFKAIFADIERDMARQRAALAARPKDAPLDLAATGT
jgi:TolB-like protein/Tfp pilus assembly protein PilF